MTYTRLGQLSWVAVYPAPGNGEYPEAVPRLCCTRDAYARGLGWSFPQVRAPSMLLA